MKRNVLILLSVLVIAMFIVGCGTEEVVDEDFPAELEEDDTSALAGQATFLNVDAAMLANGLTLNKGFNIVKWPSSGLADNIPAEEAFASLLSDMKYAKDASIKGRIYYFPPEGVYKKYINMFKQKGWWFDEVALGHKFYIYLSKTAILKYPLAQGETVEGPVCDWLGYTMAYDYNSDGKFDEADTVILKNVVMKKATCPAGKSCDPSGDGKTNIMDLQKLTVELNACLNGTKKDCPPVKTGKFKCVYKYGSWNAMDEVYGPNCKLNVTNVGSKWCGAKELCKDGVGCCEGSFNAYCTNNTHLINETKAICPGEEEKVVKSDTTSCKYMFSGGYGLCLDKGDSSQCAKCNTTICKKNVTDSYATKGALKPLIQNNPNCAYMYPKNTWEESGVVSGSACSDATS
jgi:hypothetical protein